MGYHSRARLDKDILHHRTANHLPHSDFGQAGGCRDLGEGGLAADGEGVREPEAGDGVLGDHVGWQEAHQVLPRSQDQAAEALRVIDYGLASGFNVRIFLRDLAVARTVNVEGRRG